MYTTIQAISQRLDAAEAENEYEPAQTRKELHQLHIALLEAVAREQLRPTWKGMDFLDITTLIYPLDVVVCSVTSNHARSHIQTTEAMFFLHSTPMHYNAVLAIKQDTKVTLIW
jgi:hypothetical protein